MLPPDLVAYSDEPTNSLFLSKRYAQASIAFQRAGCPREAAVCDAYLLREKARSQPNAARAPREKAFIEAAVAFNTSARAAPPELEYERREYYRNAGECFSEGSKLDEAGKNYVKAEEYTLAARIFRKGGHFDEMVEVLQLYRDSVDGQVARHLTQVARMFYFKVSRGLHESEAYSNQRPGRRHLVSNRTEQRVVM